MIQSSPGLHAVAHRGGDTRTRMGLTMPIPDESFAEAFAQLWPHLDPLYRSFSGDGLLIAAARTGRAIEAYLHLALDRSAGDRPEFVVVGRHSACDLRLGQDDSISLRHVMVSAERRSDELRVRLLDLATDAGILTEDGQRCCGLAADGAAFVGLGQYKLFLLPTGSLAPLPWGATAAESWAAIPERVYVDQRSAGMSADQAPRVRLVPSFDRQSIATQILDPPTTLREAKPAPGTRGARVGRIGLQAGAASESYDVHAADLARGLLVGRYDRCTVGAEDDRLSRVHLLLIHDHDACWAVDTASSNGTTVNGDRIRQVPLDAPAQLCLAKAITVTWTPA
jgi:hypothetical protein